MAIQHSCNSYFFQLIRDVVEKYSYNEPGKGLDLLDKHLYDFGLGKELGIDHLHENKGFIPDSKYYDRLYREEVSGWKSTYIMSIGIGQGELQLTTLQMANLAAILANRGYYFTPHLIKEIKADNVDISVEFQEKRSVKIDPEFFPYVIDGMENVVISGTARIAAIPGISVCGKTGTSQNPHGKDHSVFFAFAPKENPKIAIAVYVENAGWGSSYAAPIASLMMEKYLTGEISRQRKWLEDRMLNADLITNP
jgi:penicillin-binding protein 2